MDEKDDTNKSFGLERINNLEITGRTFKALTGFDPVAEYKYSFGVLAVLGPYKAFPFKQFLP